ncbi:hypothetical protein HMPREF1092_03269 [Clostridium thermobutyricum]|uniref:Uncharacterized protein n=1 Tax=Clostridium thermobutyricum TaxID=29372 RepID=N9W7E3_9CLOT|nr:hypothetical protein [Clostridium thermobutyricum]ENY98789.1 hypothetical protein HMPREF1092_03269 [Clostridium thermobutyricum]
MNRKNMVLILISIISIVIIALFASNFIGTNIKFLIILDVVLLMIMSIFMIIYMLINVFKMINILRILKNMFTEKEIEDTRHKSIKHINNNFTK